jgi:hypothetical protein
MELAFTDREGIMGLMEGLIAAAFREVLGVEVSGLKRGGGFLGSAGRDGAREKERAPTAAAVSVVGGGKGVGVHTGPCVA